MKTRLRPLLAALALGLAFLPVALRADSMPAPTRVARLDALVGLAPEQKAAALDIFSGENAILDSFTTLEDRMLKGAPARDSSRAHIRAMLTPEQRKKYDLSPQADGGGLMSNPENMVERADKLLRFSADQRRQALAIIWNELIEQIAATPDDEAPKGFFWTQAVQDHLRTIMTAEQLRLYDTTPFSQGGGMVRGPQKR